MQHQEKDTWLSNDCYNESKAIFRNLDTWVRDTNWGFSGDSDSKDTGCNAGVTGLFPGSGRSSGERNGNPLQYSCLESPINREALWATVHEVPRVRHDLVTEPPPPPVCITSFSIAFWTKVTEWMAYIHYLFPIKFSY